MAADSNSRMSHEGLPGEVQRHHGGGPDFTVGSTTFEVLFR